MEETWVKIISQYGVPSFLAGVLLFFGIKGGGKMLDAHLIGFQKLTEGLDKIVSRIELSDSASERRQGDIRLAIEESAKETRHSIANQLNQVTFWILRGQDAKTAAEFRATVDAKTRATDT